MAVPSEPRARPFERRGIVPTCPPLLMSELPPDADAAPQGVPSAEPLAAPNPGPTPTAGAQAAILVDYQNLHHYLKGRTEPNSSTADLAAQLFLALRDRLALDSIRLTRGRAYADFGALDENARHVQRSLYLHGIDPVFVPATMHRNTTDLQLAVDAIEMRVQHPEIGTFLLVAGDRDYAPVVQALLSAGKTVLVVGFKEHLSPFLLEHTNGGEYLDAASLLPTDALVPEVEIGSPIEVTVFAEIVDPAYEIDYDALEVIEKYFGQYDEIYLTPLLRRLSEEIGEVADHDPKSLISDLEECGAARLERRRGMPYDYTVLIVNSDHPAVIEIREELGTADAVTTDDGLPFDEAPEI